MRSTLCPSLLLVYSRSCGCHSSLPSRYVVSPGWKPSRTASGTAARCSGSLLAGSEATTLSFSAPMCDTEPYLVEEAAAAATAHVGHTPHHRRGHPIRGKRSRRHVMMAGMGRSQRTCIEVDRWPAPIRFPTVSVRVSTIATTSYLTNAFLA
jgi:hypothetical protein